MRFIHLRRAAALGTLLVVAGCGSEVAEKAQQRPMPVAIAEDAEIVLPDESAGLPLLTEVAAHRSSGLAEATHVSISLLAAQKWGLSAGRANVIGQAADDPDTYESGFDNAYNQQWSHAYIYAWWGSWIWGDANENFDDCITGRLAGQLEGPECKDGQSAKQWYQAANQQMGDKFLGYATHYIEDVSMILHTSAPNPDMVTQHFAYEAWVKNNWTAGHNFSATVAADGYYYTITDLQQAVRNTAWAASYWNTGSAGQLAWDAYAASGYPTGVGTGNAQVVAQTKTMLIRASRYALGAIKYTLDTYGQWTSLY